MFCDQNNHSSFTTPVNPQVMTVSGGLGFPKISVYTWLCQYLNNEITFTKCFIHVSYCGSRAYTGHKVE